MTKYKVTHPADGSEGFWIFEPAFLENYTTMRFCDGNGELRDYQIIKTKNVQKILDNAKAEGISVELVQ